MKRSAKNIVAHDVSPGPSSSTVHSKKFKKGNVDAAVKEDFLNWRQGRLQNGRVYYTKVDEIPDCFNETSFSLSDILNEIRPELSIHFNFMVELGWLLDQYPPTCRSTPISLIVGEKQGSTSAGLKSEVEQMHLEHVQVGGASIPLPYGTHHTKMSLFESDNWLHIVVSTANLYEGDWGGKTQAFYYCSAQLDSDNTTTSKCPFQEDLMSYLKRYKNSLVKYWIERIEGANFGGNSDRLIYSSPGYHKGDEKEKVGHLLLRSVLSSRNSEQGAPLFVAQCSSIGSLGARSEQWMFAQFINSLSGGKRKADARLFLVYPTVSDVRGSIEGWNAGGSLPYPAATEKKQPWLRSYMCRWRSEIRGRSRAMPHVKSYVEFGSDRLPKWCLITSANLSKAAWGEIQKNGEQIMVRSWEAGVLIQDPSRIEFPFDYPIAKYKPEDRPWIIDDNYTEEDRFGKQWLYNRD